MAQETFSPLTREYPAVTQHQPIDLVKINSVVTKLADGQSVKMEAVIEANEHLQMLLDEVCLHGFLQTVEAARIQMIQDNEVELKTE